MAENTAKIYWLTGLSGAGKTTIAKLLAAELRHENPAVVLLDGDALRDVFGATTDYSMEARRAMSMRYAHLCHMLAAQGITVVCATISMFDSTRAWNRENQPGYVEVYVKVPLDELKNRDSKQIYSRAEKGELKDVLGMDIGFEEPKTPDVVINNYGGATPEMAVAHILNRGK